MIRWLPVGVVAGLLFANTSGAVGLDLTVNSCPGVAGSSQESELNCAAGQTLELYVLFRPAEEIPDLIAADMLFDITVAGDAHSSSDFWDFQVANEGSIQVERAPVANQCSGWTTGLWTVPGAGSAWAAAVIYPTRIRVATVVYRPDSLRVLDNQRIFAHRILIDTQSSIEHGGDRSGCCTPGTTIQLTQVVPGSKHNLPVTTIDQGSSYRSNVVTTYPGPACTASVPAKRNTWGALKSLYR